MDVLSKMFIGIVLILLWIPGIFWSEINNRGNWIETQKLKKEIDDNFLFTGKIVSDKNNIVLNTNSGVMNVKNSVGAIQYYSNYTKKNQPLYDKKGRYVGSRQVGKWSNYQIGENGLHDFKVKNDENREIDIYYNDLKFNEAVGLTSNVGRYNVDFNGGRWSGNTLFTNNNSRQHQIKSIPPGMRVTIFAKNENLERVNDETTKLIYPGRKTKTDIINDREKSNVLQRWGFRLLAFLALFFGLVLIIEPIRIVLNKGPELLKLPILNIIQPLASIIGKTILFLWDTFSFVGSLLLTAILTAIVYFLVNYTLISGISLGILIIVIIVLNVYSKQ